MGGEGEGPPGNSLFPLGARRLPAFKVKLTSMLGYRPICSHMSQLLGLVTQMYGN